MCFFSKKNLDRTKIYLNIKQFIMFGIVGVSNTLISLLTYYALIYIGINYIISNTVGFIISVLNAYYWNNRYVFKKGNKSNIRAMAKTFVSYGITFVFSTVLLVVMIQYFKISKVIAPVLNLILTIPINFLLNKFWAFR